jgi:hypothetical protein
MYFAENPKVAKEYQNRLADFGSPYTFQYQDKIYEPSYLDNVRDPVRHAISLTYHQGKSQAQKIAKMGLEDTAKGEPYALEMGGKEYYQKMLETAKSLTKKDIKAQQGAFYKVNIPDEYMPKMLDWDKPLSEQNLFIKNAFQYNEPSISNLEAKLTGSSNPDWKYSADGFPAAPTQQQAIENAVNAMKSSSWYKGNTGEQLYKDIAKKYSTQNNPLAFKEASNELSKLGITGIKYLDQGSRKASGTSNYVVFDPSNVEILERNNMGLLK